jgi:hypothetical protein
MKDHAVNGNGCATTTATAAGSIGRRHIHLRHQPTTKYIAGRIGIRRHRNCPD